MAGEKGFCKYCYKEGEEVRFFDVVSKNKIVYCPNCGHKFSNEEALQGYKDFFNNLYEKGENYLLKAGDYNKAWITFSKIISIEEKDVYARYGRLLALMYSSTLRTPKFKEVELLFNEDKNKYFRSPSYVEHYFMFLKLFNLSLENYIKFILNNLTVHGYFYDSEGVSLYFERLFEIKKLKNLVVEESDYLIKKYDEPQYLTFADQAKSEEERIVKTLKTGVIDLSGNLYKFGRIGVDGKPLIGYSDQKEIVNVKRPAIGVSVSIKPGFITCDDYVFGNKKATYKYTRFTIPVFILSAALSGVFLLLFVFVDFLKYLWLIFAALSLIVCFVFIILRLVWNNTYKNDNYMLIKPFRRK